MRLALIFVVVIALLLGSGWWFSPDIVRWYAAGIAEELGIEALEIDLERPGLRTVQIHSVKLQRENVAIEAANVSLEFDPIALALESVRAANLDIRVALADETSAQPAEASSTESALDIAALPSIVIEALTVGVEPLGFRAAGAVALSAGAAQFSLRASAPDAAAGFAIEGALDDAGNVSVMWRDENDTEFLTTRSSFPTDTLTIEGAYDLHDYPLTLLSTLAGIPDVSGAVAGSFAAEMPWPIEGLDAAQVEASYALDLATEDVSMRARGSLRGTATAATLTVAEGSVRLPAVNARFDVEPDALVTISPETVTFDSPVAFTASPSTDLNIESNLTDLSIDLASSTTIEFSSAAKISGYGFGTAADARTRLVLRDGRVQGTTDLSSGLIEMPLKLEYVDGALEISGRSHTVIDRPLFGSTLDEWETPLDFDAGEMDVELKVARGTESVGGSLRVELNGFDGNYDGDPITDVSGILTFAFNDDGFVLTRSPLQIATFDVGFPVNDIQLDVALTDNDLTIANARAALLGGAARLADFVYDTSTQTAAIDVALENLDLAEVLALEGEDITGTGILSGSLPVQVEAGKVSINNGTLAAAPGGGRIELSQSLAVPTGQPGLDFAMQALTNFTYETLSTTIDYAETGDIAMKVNLRGSNPDVEKGRAIQYNLNVTENIFALTDSLRAQRAITDRVEEHVRGQNQ